MRLNISRPSNPPTSPPFIPSKPLSAPFKMQNFSLRQRFVLIGEIFTRNHANLHRCRCLYYLHFNSTGSTEIIQFWIFLRRIQSDGARIYGYFDLWFKWFVVYKRFLIYKRLCDYKWNILINKWFLLYKWFLAYKRFIVYEWFWGSWWFFFRFWWIFCWFFWARVYKWIWLVGWLGRWRSGCWFISGRWNWW